jgi:hypothetical protein
MRVTMQKSTSCKDKFPKHYRSGNIAPRILLAIIGLTFVFCANLVAENSSSVKIFAFQPPDVSPDVEAPAMVELKDPAVYGLSWRFRWDTIEPQEGQYNWALIDKAVEVTSKVGKKAMLRVVAGMHTPAWVYQAGAKPFDFSNTDLRYAKSQKEGTRMPIPWDEIYLARWEAFIQAFGKRYAKNPHIYSIPMSGGGRIGEMNLPKAFEKWRQAGYSDEKLIAAWKRIIDAYQRAFPDVPTNLCINEPLGKGHSNVMRPVISYVLATYPQKVYLQENALKADFPPNNPIRRILREASAKTSIGYQMLGSRNFLDKETGDRFKAFRNAIEDHASYVEVYTTDVKDPAQRSALQFLAAPSERR